MSTHIRIKVFVAEDSLLIRDRLVEMLGEVDGVTVVGAVETPGDAIAGILQTDPDFVVIVYQLKGGTDVDVLNAVHSQSPATVFPVFLVLTNHANPQYRRICQEAGAAFFFDKSLEFDKVRDVVAAAA